MDDNLLRLAVLLLLLKGDREKDIFDELTKKVADKPNENSRKKTKSQTYVRATTLEEFIEVERTDENGTKSYKVDAKLEPFEIFSPVRETIKDKDKDLRVSLELQNLKMEGTNKFKINGSSNNEKMKDRATIKFDLPSAVKLNSSYVVTGTMGDKKIKGNGKFELSVMGVSVQGIVNIADDGQELNIQNLELKYDFENIQLNFTGLEIEGMGDDKTEKLVFDVTKNYLKRNKEQISERIASDIRIKLNRKLKGVSSTKIISILKGV